MSLRLSLSLSAPRTNPPPLTHNCNYYYSYEPIVAGDFLMEKHLAATVGESKK